MEGSNLTPLFKKGSRLERSNYRPVSLTYTICKILESIIRDKVMKYLQLNSVKSTWIRSKQSMCYESTGNVRYYYRRGYSTG